jgi:dihydropteroate synthase
MSRSLPPTARSFSPSLRSRAEVWQLRNRRLHLPQRPLLMGILNVTPDSFSDGGQFADVKAAVEHGLRLASEGADLLDIGGESTRPYSQPVDAREELDRVLPVIKELIPHLLIPISIDTSKAAVAREAIAAGAEAINDITALAGDPEMVDEALKTRAGVCAMHMRGTPQTMQDDPTYDDVVGEVFEFLRGRRDALVAAGIEQERIALDPGIGFGKTHQHNLTLLAHCHRFHALGCPLLVGHSRKGFIGRVIDDKSADPTPGTIGVAIALANQGVQILRVHDVAAVRQALMLYEAAGGVAFDRES